MKVVIAITCLVAAVGLTVAQQCAPGAFECANGHCIPVNCVCDGDNDCGDMSDESDQNGNCPDCPPAFFKCNNGRCIYKEWVCDGNNNCGDASDEQQNCPPCPEDRHQCDNGVCTDPRQTCNGNDDCGDGSDETEEACPCAEGEIRCSNEGSDRACIPPEWVCDEENIWDCPNGDDEANCTVRSVGTKHYHVRPIHLKTRKVAVPKKKLGLVNKNVHSTKHLWYKVKKQTGKRK